MFLPNIIRICLQLEKTLKHSVVRTGDCPIMVVLPHESFCRQVISVFTEL